MPGPSVQDVFLVGVDVLRTDVSSKSKAILAQIGSVVGKTVLSSNVEWVQHAGLASRPPEPEAGKVACQGYGIRLGGTNFLLGSQDSRGRALYGSLSPGETSLYAGGSDGKAQARVLLKANGSVNLFTKKGNTDGGTGVSLSLSADGSIAAAGSEGNALILDSDGAVDLFNANGGLSIDASGKVTLAGASQVAISAGSVAFGGPSALPIAIGPNVVTAIASLQTQITALQVELTACITALLAIPINAPAASATGPAIATGTAATTAGAISVSAASAIIPSTRTSSD